MHFKVLKKILIKSPIRLLFDDSTYWCESSSEQSLPFSNPDNLGVLDPLVRWALSRQGWRPWVQDSQSLVFALTSNQLATRFPTDRLNFIFVILRSSEFFLCVTQKGFLELTKCHTHFLTGKWKTSCDMTRSHRKSEVADDVAKMLSAAGWKFTVSILRGCEDRVTSGWLSPECGNPAGGILHNLTYERGVIFRPQLDDWLSVVHVDTYGCVVWSSRKESIVKRAELKVGDKIWMCMDEWDTAFVLPALGINRQNC